MMDFKKSLTNGLEAAKKARKNKEEIQGVIDEVSEAINDYSNGLISLVVTKEQRVAQNIGSLVGGAAAAFGLSPWVQYKTLSLLLKKDQLQKKEKIAEWRIDESDGYPCVISYNGDDISCGTKEMLEKALGNLMANASTGERLLKLITEGEQSE
ncbi:hypothetical protein DRW71_06105 [Salmonella enterica subsp. diarizonae]|nr:hypothetical protein [Salmonella enterica]ECC9189370.1 hypothetical protein [Salmonella enterica subsp. diarizonae]EBE1334712.1 hypothetical protein [Salmonella enterica]EBI1319066.1 hypothetical protein [Salmonella enterica]EBK3090177.1 hypothetical protein [Salmonella enterica]